MKKRLQKELYRIDVVHAKDGRVVDVDFFFTFRPNQPFSLREYKNKSRSRKWMEGIVNAILK